jgi:hypothetical protein
MNLNALNEFRHAVYGCFKQAGDALFNALDALSSETAAHSFPELSLSPFFQRRWPSLYVANIYRPWETRRALLTLTQVRRAMPTLLTQLGTPARPPQLRGKAPGRAKGFHPKPAPRHPVICNKGTQCGVHVRFALCFLSSIFEHPSESVNRRNIDGYLRCLMTFFHVFENCCYLFSFSPKNTLLIVLIKSGINKAESTVSLTFEQLSPLR